MCLYSQHSYDSFLLSVSFLTLVLLTVWGIHFAPEENIMTLSLGKKIFHFLLLPEAVMSFQFLQKFRKLLNFDRAIESFQS